MSSRGGHGDRSVTPASLRDTSQLGQAALYQSGIIVRMLTHRAMRSTATIGQYRNRSLMAASSANSGDARQSRVSEIFIIREKASGMLCRFDRPRSERALLEMRLICGIFIGGAVVAGSNSSSGGRGGLAIPALAGVK